MNTVKKWAIATRLATTTLALTSVGLGSALAAFRGAFDGRVGVWAALTAALLQSLCNLANDYGDLVHGADPINDVKPPSALQTGLVTLAQVRRALQWLVGATIGCGILLLYAARLSLAGIGVFMLLGALAVIAAITYTMGSKPYGYQGWGDVAVFTFFGLVGVGGTFYLHTQQLSSSWLLPAISHGSLVVGVLNVNNLRDRAFDVQVGKQTIPVRIGKSAAVAYHWSLLWVSLATTVAFLWLYTNTFWPRLCLTVFPLLIKNGSAVSSKQAAHLNRQLQNLVLLIVLWTALLAVGLVLEQYLH